jgi:hypothetical protein
MRRIGPAGIGEIAEVVRENGSPSASAPMWLGRVSTRLADVEKPATWKPARTAVLLVISGISLYVFLPSLMAVASSWRALEHVDWPFAVLVFVCEAASLVCLWELDRIALRTRAWFPVATAQLSGNVAGRILRVAEQRRPRSPSLSSVAQASTPAKQPLRSGRRRSCRSRRRWHCPSSRSRRFWPVRR